MNAGIKTAILTKADRVNARIDEFEHIFLNMDSIKDKDTISKQEFKEFVKSIHLIVTTELSEKGVERKWNKQ